MVQMIHRITIAGSLFLAMTLAPMALAEGEDVARGEALFKTCTPCHGTVGEGRDYATAPSVAGLPQWYVEAQIMKFQTGARGAHPADLDGLRMRPMSRALFGDEDRAAVAAYIGQLPPVASAHSVDGDAEKGKALYIPCIACHGPEGQGNQALGGPPLTNMTDWYLESSIHKFKDGLRGADASKDPSGALMRTMAMTLTNDQAVRDVVAYLRTLGN